MQTCLLNFFLLTCAFRNSHFNRSCTHSGFWKLQARCWKPMPMGVMSYMYWKMLVIWVKYVALFWTLPTPQTILVTGLDQKLARPVSNCDSWGLSFQVLGFRVHVRIPLLFDDQRPAQLCSLLNLECCLHFDHILNFIITHVYVVSIRDDQPYHVPFKCKCPIKKSDHIRPTHHTMLVLPT